MGFWIAHLVPILPKHRSHMDSLKLSKLIFFNDSANLKLALQKCLIQAHRQLEKSGKGGLGDMKPPINMYKTL